MKTFSQQASPAHRLASTAVIVLLVGVLCCLTASSARADSDPLVLVPTWPSSGAFVGPGPNVFSYFVNGGEAPIDVRCQIDDGLWLAWTECDSNFTAPPLSNGFHRLEIRATDADGNANWANVPFFVYGVDPAPDPPSRPFWSDTQCPKIGMIGVAGSGENGGPGTDHSHQAVLGLPVGEFALQLADRIDARFGVNAMAEPLALDYPAASVGTENPTQAWNGVSALMNANEYRESVAAGESALQFELDRFLAGPCAGRTHLVLAGYSQGAQVIGNVLSRWRSVFPRRSRAHIGSVVFFGDPKFNPKAASVHPKSNFDSGSSGLLGARDRAALAGFKTLSFCHDADPICQGLPGDGLEHSNYHAGDAAWAANELSWYVPYARGDIPRSDVSALAIRINPTLSPAGDSLLLQCTLNDSRTGKIALGPSTCMLRGKLIARWSGGGMPSDSRSESFDHRPLTFDSGFTNRYIGLNSIRAGVPVCSPAFYTCSRRRVTISMEVTAWASSPNRSETRSTRYVFPLVDRYG